MSAKPRFKPRVGWADEFLGGKWWNASPMDFKRYGKSVRQKVRVLDARDLTPEKAVEKVLQVRYDLIPQGLKKTQGDRLCEHAKAAGMTARVVNGKVRVRRANA